MTPQSTVGVSSFGVADAAYIADATYASVEIDMAVNQFRSIVARLSDDDRRLLVVASLFERLLKYVRACIREQGKQPAHALGLADIGRSLAARRGRPRKTISGPILAAALKRRDELKARFQSEKAAGGTVTFQGDIRAAIQDHCPKHQQADLLRQIQVAGWKPSDAAARIAAAEFRLPLGRVRAGRSKRPRRPGGHRLTRLNEINGAVTSHAAGRLERAAVADPRRSTSIRSKSRS